MTGNDAQEYNTADIRQLLLAAFTPEELRRFCYDRPDFRPVVRRFSPRHSLEDMADELITYCDNYLIFPELLTELQQHNARQYARFIKQEPHVEKPAPSIPELALSPSDRDTITNPIRLDMVRVPAGEFQMGSVVARDKHARDVELPPHTVYLPEFYIGKYPVMNRQYHTFVQATGHQAPDHWHKGRIPWRKDNHPVVNVSWHDAVAFCDWLSRESRQPFRLPTEAEWEKAARGTDGRIYPWGDDLPDKGRCNYGKLTGLLAGQTKPVGSYSPQGDSPYGCADMAGNVLEWCQSLDRPYPYQADDGREDLEAAGWRVWRGGSWAHLAERVRCAYHSGYDPHSRHGYTGFRVARAPLR